MMKKQSGFLRSLPMEAVQRGILYTVGLVLVGVALTGWASASIRVVMITAAVLLLASGAWDVLRYVREAPAEARKNQRFARGLMAAVISVLMLVYGDQLGAWLPIVLASLLFFVAAIRCQSALDLKRAGAQRWLPFLVLAGVITLAAALMLALNLDADWKLRIVGVFALADAVADAIARLMLWQLDKKSRKREESAEGPDQRAEAVQQPEAPAAAQTAAETASQVNQQNEASTDA